jgi:redox-sensitive bicupin YhaK (pirin superfamily)
MHSPEFTARGGQFHALQLWVNLPAKSKMTAPRYQTLTVRDIPSVALPAGAGELRIIAGEFGGTRGPAQTFTPVNLFELRLRAGGNVKLDLREGYSAGLYVVSGQVTANGERAVGGELVVLDRKGAEASLEATSDAVVFVMNGAPINEPVAGYGPFVMNTPQEIQRAFADYQAGLLGKIPESVH